MRSFAVALCALALAGCIPQVGAPPPSEPYRQPPPPAPPPVRAEPPRPQPQPPRQVQRLPAPPPAWEARPVSADAQLVSATTYTVRPGDSLQGIASRTGAGSAAIAHANNIPPPFVIQPGQRLTIPGGRYHLVRQGESGIAIARAYGVDWSRIVTENGLEEPFILRVSQRLLIPDTGPATVEERAAAFHIDIDDLLTGGEPALAENAAPAAPTASSRRVLSSTTAVAEPRQLIGGFAWPVRGELVSHFGAGGSGVRNNGINIAVPLDTPIHAAADGVVAYVGSDIPALGGLVILKHGNGYATVYGHAGELLVRRGQSVKRGQTIARSGNSGVADRPELHFEIRQGRNPIDPLGRLPSAG